MIDSHCHLDVKAFDGDRDAMFERAALAGVSAMVVPGIAIPDMPRVLALADAHAAVFVGVGVHPHEAGTFTDEVPAQLREWARHPKVVAIGEIGLDYYYDHAPREVQQDVLRTQIRLAREVRKPVIIHDRDAHEDVLAILTEELDREVGGVMHCFSGSLELARACIGLGMAISFAGPLTFKSAVALQDVARELPLDTLLIETDSPYLAPIPYRGKRNEPAHVAHVAQKLAELRGLPCEAIAEATSRNTRRLFKIPG